MSWGFPASRATRYSCAAADGARRAAIADAGRSGQFQGGDGQQRGGQIARTVGRVAPAVVVVLMFDEPGNAGGNARPVASRLGQRKGADGGCRRQGRGGKPALPKAVGMHRSAQGDRRGRPRCREGRGLRPSTGGVKLIARPSTRARQRGLSIAGFGRGPSVATPRLFNRGTPAAAWLSA